MILSLLRHGLFVGALIVVCGLGARAQSQRLLFPAVSGNELVGRVQDAYTPVGPLDYGIARDTLFRRVWATDKDSLVGQYSGFAISLPKGVDPTEFAFSKGINTEHLYPQSKGAEIGNARADMHHLYPTRIDVNADRGSLPFGESPDASTQRWYRRDKKLTSPPPLNVRDQYSEGTNSVFEPRESIKGDIARAVFYFWTIHRDVARQADPNFFSQMRADLCDWHNADPVDADEALRSQRIARYQGNENPFVLDCTLPDRLSYCPTRSAACDRAVPVDELGPGRQIHAYPNPVRDILFIEGIPVGSTLRLSDALGRNIKIWTAEMLQSEGAETASLTWVLPTGLQPGIYQLSISAGGQSLRLLILGPE